MDPAGDQAEVKRSGGDHAPNLAPYPILDPKDVDPASPSIPPSSAPSPAAKSVTWSQNLTAESPPPPTSNWRDDAPMPPESNPYVTPAAAPSSAAKNTMETVRDVLGMLGKKTSEAAKKASEATKKAEDLAGNVWQHLKTGPSFAEAAMGRIAQGTKVIAEGGYEKIFQQTFEVLPEEQLKDSYACYLSTSAGPVMGILYVSTAKLAFCSDNPLSYKVGDQTEWSYYKVVIPLHQLRAANPSTSKSNTAEKYIQIVSVDNHEFWFMGFVSYGSAVAGLQEALNDARDLQP